jgi:hypothetical protein
VEAAKALAREVTAEYKEKGSLPIETPILSDNDIAVYGDIKAGTPADAIKRFLGNAQAGAYIALQAYVQPTLEINNALQIEVVA